MSDDIQDSSKIARLFPGESRDGAPVPATLENLQSDFAALRGEINRRDEILKLVLERLPAAQASDQITNDKLARAEAARDEALSKFDHMQDLISTLTQKVSDLASPSEAIAALTELKYQVDDARRNTGEQFALLHNEMTTLKRRMTSLENLERKDIKAEHREIEKIERDVALLNDNLMADRAMMTEMRLDMGSGPSSPSAGQTELTARVETVETEMGGLKDKVVRFLLDQMKQSRQ